MTRPAVSLKKHLAYGAIFASMAAGYGLAQLARSLPTLRFAASACCVVAMIYPAVNGFQEARSWYQSWPNQDSLLSKLDPLLTPQATVAVAVGNGEYLCPYYYAGMGNDWENCSSGITIGDVDAARPTVVVLGYSTSVAPPSHLPAGLLLSTNGKPTGSVGCHQ